jgi:hypothetical protein
MMTASEGTNTEWFLSHQTSATGFVCSGLPSLSQIGENVENMRVGCEECIYLMMIATL